MRRPAALLSLILALTAAAAEARVERLEVTERVPFAEGTAFGDAGAYEKIRGVAHIALDPADPANARIVDLGLAPRDARGLVTFRAPFLMLRPADPAKGRGTLVYDVNNRGNLAMLGQLNEARHGNDPTTAAHAGNGYLFRQGYTLLWSAWVWDVAPGPNLLILDPPVATDGGRPITGRVAYEFIVDAPAATASFVGRSSIAYPQAERAEPVLTMRRAQLDERLAVAPGQWSLVERTDGQPPTEVRLEGGFRPGWLYELTYTARDPKVVGAGMAGIRDLLSYLRSQPFEGAPAPEAVLMYGISQSGRLIQHMVWEGFHVGEDGRPVMDGAVVHVAGGGKGSFNHRFALPTRHFSMLEEHGYPTDFFPFASTVTAEPKAPAWKASVLDRARELGAVPKLFYTNSSAEYWNRSASLLHTTPDGRADLPQDPNVRVYHLASAQHYVGRSRERGIYANCVNTLNHQAAMRALLPALDRWVRDGKAPPDSAHPTVAAGTLVDMEGYRAAFPAVPGLRLPDGYLEPPRLDLGARWKEGIVDVVPPRPWMPFNTLVPRPDADGQDLAGGIVLPDVAVPLGTRTGWNTRAEAAGFPGATARWDGSFVPFARTEAERTAAGDPRPSLEARYGTKERYLGLLRAAAERSVAQGFMLAEEVEPTLAASAGLWDRIMARAPGDAGCTYLYQE